MTEGLPHEQPYDLQDNTKCYDTDKDEKKESALKIMAEWNKEQETKKQQGISVSEALRLHNENATCRRRHYLSLQAHDLTRAFLK